MPDVDREAPNRNHTQSVLFRKDEWTRAESREWLVEHDHFTDGYEETENLHRWRQYQPDAGRFRYRNEQIGDGITLVLAFRKDEDMLGHPFSKKKPFRGFWAGPTWAQEEEEHPKDQEEEEEHPMAQEEEKEHPMAELLLFDVIGPDFFGDGITGLQVREAFATLGGQDVRVRINSPGGDVFEGLAIHNALRDHPGRVQVVVDALAASAAAIVAMAGDEILMVENATLMIHEPWTVAVGDAAELRAQADILETINAGLVTTFARRTGLPRDEVAQLLRAETWLSADQAVAAGFADRTVEPGGVRNQFDMKQFSKPKRVWRKDVESFLSRLPQEEQDRAGILRTERAKLRLRMAMLDN